jgi:hypothetical protein
MYKVSGELLEKIKTLLQYVEVGNEVTVKMSLEADRLIGILEEEYYV